MNYFKGLVSNVRGFYSEINSATLTGAIDVVVVRQEDGTFCGSPFHVRFGKLGVLRSREKIVDIQINGEPVDLQMKLGDAGEAFFVEEVEEPAEVPTELCTSPIPSTISAETGVCEKKEENAMEGECETPTEDDGEKTPKVLEFPENTAKEFEYKLVDESNENSHNDDDQESESNLTKDEENQVGDKVDKEKDKDAALQDHKKESNERHYNTSKDDGADLKNDKLSDDAKNSEVKENGKKDKVKEKEMNESRVKRNEKKISICSEDSLDHSTEDNKDYDLKIYIPDANVHDDTEVDYDPTHKEEDSEHSLSQSIPIPRRMVESDYNDQWMSDTEVSLLKDERFKLEHLYPLSDLDSPIGSPPNPGDIGPMKSFNPDQHCVSDTEAEIQQSQENMNVIEQVTWDWGKLPQGPEGVYKQERNINNMKREEGHHHSFRNKRLNHHKSHKIKEEGIYLDDLTTIDQEVAALYLDQALSKDARKTLSVESPTIEDIESGIGQSLPSSPTSELSSTRDSAGSETYSDLAMSLCGDLKSGKVSLESFMSNKVTFEDLSSNPSLLNDPKLVIRINDRYYNWQIAAPMLMSYMIYQRPLKQETVTSLIKQHMPKKEKRRGYYWFSWRQNDESSDEDDFDPTKEKFRPRIHSNSRKQHTTTPTQLNNKEGSTTTQAETEASDKHETKEDIEMKDKSEEMNIEKLMVSQARVRNMSECTSGNESDVGYKKTTRLTSEQLAKLNLHNGPNSIHFSVTTKYQGTAECQATIYLWNYDDRVVISDIDGTITKSDVLGQILPVVGQAWAQSGVAQFFTLIQRNGYKLLYLSARAIGQAQITRDYLKSVKQDQITLPDGPLLLSPASLIKAFHREVIEKKPEEFKIAALRDIMSLFRTNKKPFYSGFGNKINDVYSYRAVGVSLSRIFTINHRGEVRNELTKTFQSSYLDLRHLVDQMFPPYKRMETSSKSSGLIASDEFSSFTYWRNPLPEVDVEEMQESYIDDDVPVTFTG